MAKRPPLRRRDGYEAKERQQREAVLAEFEAGDTDATLQGGSRLAGDY